MLKTLMTTAALASLFLAGAAAAQTPIRNAAGDYTTGPITTDQAWANGVTYWGEYRQVHSPEYFDTIPYDPQKDPGAGGLRFPEFRVILQKEFDQADRNDNGRIDNETERCLFHRTPEGIAAGGVGFAEGQIDEATRRRQTYIAGLRTWTGPSDWTGSGEWPLNGATTEEFHTLAGKDGQLTWSDIPGCAFMAQAGGQPPVSPTAPPAGPTQPPVTPVPTPAPAPTTPVQPAVACTPPSQQEATRLVFTSWADGRLTRAEADALNRGRHCQLDGDGNGSLTEAEFLAVSLADFDRADRNKDGVLSGRQEIGALASIGGEAQSGLTRAQASDLAKLRFAVLDRQPRDGAVTLAEYLAVTAEEFARNDANGDGALTGAEARRQAQ